MVAVPFLLSASLSLSLSLPLSLSPPRITIHVSDGGESTCDKSTMKGTRRPGEGQTRDAGEEEEGEREREGDEDVEDRGAGR